MERGLLERQLAMKDPQSPSWVSMVQSLLTDYNLPSMLDILHDPPEKISWSRRTTKAIRSIWESKLKEEARSMSSLQYMVVDHCRLGQTHRVWKLEGLSSLEVSRATVKAKLLVGRYPLRSSRVAGKNYNQKCPLCEHPSETTEHFLLFCLALSEERDSILEEIHAITNNHYLTSNPRHLTQLLLDSSDTVNCDVMADRIEVLARKMCFKLHHRRSMLTGYGSQYVRVSRRGATRL